MSEQLVLGGLSRPEQPVKKSMPVKKSFHFKKKSYQVKNPCQLKNLANRLESQAVHRSKFEYRFHIRLPSHS